MSTILIVDSEEVPRRALCQALRDGHYAFIEAASGSEALDLLRSRPVDLIITEYLLAGDMNGLDFLRSVRDDHKLDALRIMLTAHADLDVAVAAINQEAVYRFVLKPWDAFDLRVMIKLALLHLAKLRAATQLARSGS